MTLPVLVDLFCGPGGATRGYQRAGFRVVGVDINPQPNYCGDEFMQHDALELLNDIADYGPTAVLYDWCGDVAAFHASPVCLTFARVTDWRGSRADHPDTLTPTLELLPQTGLPYVVENVFEACPPLRPDLVLCGSQFGLTRNGRTIKRHRAFQLGGWRHYSLRPPCNCRKAFPFEHKHERAYADAMGCDWMNKTEARQAIPPAYTEYIGRALMEHLAQEVAS